VSTGALHFRPPTIASSAAGAALLALAAAVLVILFGVIATSGVYGSRLAWLLGVALPLLALSVVLSWVARRLWRGTGGRPGCRTAHRSPARSGGPHHGRHALRDPVRVGDDGAGWVRLLFAVHGISLLL